MPLPPYSKPQLNQTINTQPCHTGDMLKLKYTHFDGSHKENSDLGDDKTLFVRNAKPFSQKYVS